MGDVERRRGVFARALALAFAVGLAGLLVGLSVAPSTLPSDTFHVTPKAAAGAAVVISHADGRDLHPSAGEAARPLANPLAIAATTLALVAVGTPLVRRRGHRRRRMAPTLPPAGGRGPPPSP